MNKDLELLFKVYDNSNTNWSVMCDDYEAKEPRWSFDKDNPSMLKAKISWLRNDDVGAEPLIAWLSNNNIPVDNITHDYLIWELTREQRTALELTFG